MSDRLTRSILATIGIYLFCQALLFFAFALPAGFAREYMLPFLVSSAGFHAFLLGMLLLFKHDFVKESTGLRLERVNLANRITLLRVSTLPTLLFLVMAARDFSIRVPLLALVVIVFASDFLDGYVSRRSGEVTKIGRMMDSSSDYSLLIVLTVVFYYFTFIPAWFFWLVVARLGLQVVLMGILMTVKRRIEPKTTFLGKVAVAGIMVSYAAVVVQRLFTIRVPEIFTALQWAVAAVVVVSMGDKISFFAKELARGTDETKGPEKA
jgi:phosphatidylglycerophosphate synthase